MSKHHRCPHHEKMPAWCAAEITARSPARAVNENCCEPHSCIRLSATSTAGADAMHSTDAMYLMEDAIATYIARVGAISSTMGAGGA